MTTVSTPTRVRETLDFHRFREGPGDEAGPVLLAAVLVADVLVTAGVRLGGDGAAVFAQGGEGGDGDLRDVDCPDASRSR